MRCFLCDLFRRSKSCLSYSWNMIFNRIFGGSGVVTFIVLELSFEVELDLNFIFDMIS